MEMIIALSIITVIFAAIFPLFGQIRDGWDSKQAAAETLQNGRILIDHMNRNLAKAVKVNAVSISSDTRGYIECQDNDAAIFRYDVNSATDYVEYGSPGGLSDLAGPVSQLRFICYDACDLDVPLDISTADVNDIRFVKAETIFKSSSPDQDKSLVASAYLRTNSSSESGLVGWWKLNETSGLTAVDSSYNDNNGTLMNMAGNEWTNGILNGALDFDGFNDYVQTTSNESKTSTDFTWACWFKADTTTGQHHLIWEGKATENGWGGSAANTHEAHINIGVPLQNDFIGCFYGTNEFSPAPGVIRIETNFSDTINWHHVAFVVTNASSSPSGELFLDGASVGTDTGNQTDRTDWDTNLRIGRPGANERYFDGKIDDVRVYGCALSDEEIIRLADVLRYREFTEAKASSNVTSITISTPSTNESDLLLAAVTTDGDTSLSLAPPMGEGWTQIDVDDYSNQVTLGAWWKLAEASESTEHQFTWSSGEQAYGWIMRFTGHDSTNPINVYSSDGESSASPTSPAVATTLNDCLILRLGAFNDDNITVDDPGLSGHTAITMDQSGSNMSDGLVGYWNMDETSGTIAVDSSGNGNNGTLINMNPTTDWVTGQIGGALDFDGSNNYVSLPIGSVINSLSNCTFAIWVNWDGSDFWERIWDFGTGTTYYMFLTPKNSYNSRMRFAITTSGMYSEEETDASTTLSSIGWHHVVVTIDADNHTHKLYLDGNPVGQNTYGYLEPDDLGITNKNYLAKSNFIADPYFHG